MNTDRPIAKPAVDGRLAAALNQDAIDEASAPLPRMT